MSSNRGPESVTIVVGVDLAEFEEGLDDVENKRKVIEANVKRTVASTTRSLIQGARLAILTVQAITGAIDQTLFMMLESLTLASEALITIATAEVLTTRNVFRAGVQFLGAIAILVQINNVNRGRDELAARQGTAISAINAATTFLG